MKKILLICAVLALAACDDKQEARDKATNANNEIEVPSVTAYTPASGDAGTVTPAAPVAGGAMVNTPVPANTPSMQNTPAPSIAAGEPNPSAPTSPCGADQSWVGKAMKDVDLSRIHNPVRTMYPDSPATMDYSEQRLNIILEHGTDKILQVKCG